MTKSAKSRQGCVMGVAASDQPLHFTNSGSRSLKKLIWHIQHLTYEAKLPSDLATFKSHVRAKRNCKVGLTALLLT